ncbi:hypothetical protein D9757_015418, partial [Collybiopsis confluens]
MAPFLQAIFQIPLALNLNIPPIPTSIPIPASLPIPTPPQIPFPFPPPAPPRPPVPSNLPPVDPPPLHSLRIGRTANGFDIPARGWNSFGLQANPKVHPDFRFNQANIIRQCDQLASTLGGYGYTYCSLDSGWSLPFWGDKHGRVVPDPRLFNLTQLTDHLHSQGLSLGVY